MTTSVSPVSHWAWYMQLHPTSWALPETSCSHAIQRKNPGQTQYIYVYIYPTGNQVLQRSHKLQDLCSAEKCPSDTVRAIFKQSTELCYTSVGYKKLAGPKFAKIYSDWADVESGIIIRSFRSGLSINILGNPDDVIQTLSCIATNYYNLLYMYSIAPIAECVSESNIIIIRLTVLVLVQRTRSP